MGFRDGSSLTGCPRQLWSTLDGFGARRERRVSRLNGLALNWEISSAPPSMSTFFMNIIIWIRAIIG